MFGRPIYDPAKKERRRGLRKNGTPAEAALWLMLKNKQLDGRRFRRQVDIGPYIVDFYCPSEDLVVEVDGHFHFTQAGSQADLICDAWLNTNGFRVLRFENRLVFRDPEGIRAEIMRHFRRV